ncbi:MAG TPA: response regulator transcription factor [Anaerolineae bacterium]|nr:response regulator transcription factor [Anaerolineae bacterium]
MTRVLIVDDQASFRHQLRQLLIYAGLEVVGEAGDISTAEGLVQSLQPELAIVDIMLPGINGLEGTRRLKALLPSLRVILISAYRDRAELYRAAAAQVGAETFIAKDDLEVDVARTWIK